MTLPWLQIPRFHALLPYESFDEQTQLFINKGATGFVLAGSPLAGASLDDQGQLAHFFRNHENLPEGASLQVLLFASPRIGPLLKAWQNPRKKEPFKHLAAKRIDFLSRIMYEPRTPLRDYKLLISYTVPGIDGNRAEVQHIRAQLQEALKLIGLPTGIVEPPQLMAEIANILTAGPDYLHKTQPESRVWNPYESLSRQILPPDFNLQVRKDGLFCEDRVFRCFSPQQTPPLWGLPHMDRFLGDFLQDSVIACPFLIHYGLTVCSGQSKERVKLSARRESLENSLKNRLSKWIPDLQEQHEEVNACLAEIARGERMISSCLSTTLIAREENLPQAESALKHVWTSANWELAPTTYDHLPMLISSLPMTWTLGYQRDLKSLNKKTYGYGMDLHVMGRGKKTITREAQNMLPILAEWKGQLTHGQPAPGSHPAPGGHPAPGMLLSGRKGQLFCWSPFGKALLPGACNGQTDHNYNVCIAGQTGSGKSVFMNELMLTVLGVGGRVFVLDYGRSFKKSCLLLGGQHIELDVRFPISLNPFTKIPADETPDSQALREEMLAILRPLFQVMAAPTTGTSDLQNAYLEQAIRQVWDLKKNQAEATDVHQLLMQSPSSDGRDVGQMLYSFTQSGIYGKFFDGPASVNLSDTLVVMETDHLRNHPDLMAVLVQMMILQINQTMASGGQPRGGQPRRDRQTPFLIVIDEAWKLLAGRNSAPFIAEATRTARKYKGSIVLGTQHLTDYFKPESPAATEAFNCAAWKCLLYQEADVIEGLKAHPQLKSFVSTPFKEALLKSVRPRPPHYSEVAIYGPDITGVVGRLMLDPFTRLLYSTSPDEYQQVQRLIDQGLPVHEAIDKVLEHGS